MIVKLGDLYLGYDDKVHEVDEEFFEWTKKDFDVDELVKEKLKYNVKEIYQKGYDDGYENAY